MRSRIVQAAGLRWRCLETGDGPPLVLLHGFPEDARSFDRIMPALVGRRLIAPDLKGYGESDMPAPGGPLGDYRLSRLADELADLIGVLAAEAGAGHIDVVGHDWGGIVLSALVARHPRLVRRAVLLNAPVVRFVPWRPIHVYAFNLPWLPEATFARDPRAFVRGILRWWTAVEAAFTEDDVARYAEALDGGSFRCALAYYRGLPRDLPFILDAWRGIRTRPTPPTLIIWGALDPILPLAVGRMGAEDLRAPLAVIPAAGHFVHREAPTQVARLILDHLC